ncbi:MAG TPA: aminoglycoside 6-adenylyltransferase [Longimicrobium sp.]|nr:aminoglycoside 6-adenylyltransferase [Longimicrobium sp.]
MTGGEPDVLGRIVRWAETEELVRAVVLTSTRAAPDARTDPFSDYDVVLYVADLAPFAGGTEWLGCVGPVLVSWPDEGVAGGLPFHMRLVIYEDETKVDFTIAPVERLRDIARSGVLPDALDVGYRVLLDRDGANAALPAPTFTAHIPPRPTQEDFSALVEEFWFETTYVAKNLWRGELLPARHSLETVMKLDLLRRVLEWRVEMDHGWSLRPGAYGRGLRRHLDAATWAELEATFGGADAAAGWESLFRTTALFRRVAMEVAAGLGLEYPHRLDERMTAHLRRVEADAGDRQSGADGG